MRVEAVARLDDRRVGELPVDRRDPLIGAVVEPAVRPDRTVDAVDEAHVVTGESAKAVEVEVERVEEADMVPAEILFTSTLSPRRSSSADERAQELVPAARRRRSELVEEREIRRPAPRPRT